MAVEWTTEKREDAPVPDAHCIRITNGEYEGVLFQFKKVSIENKYPLDKEHDEVEDGTGRMWWRWGTHVIENPNDANIKAVDWKKTHRSIMTQIAKKVADAHKPIVAQIEKAQQEGKQVVGIDHQTQMIEVIDPKTEEVFRISAETGETMNLIEGEVVKAIENDSKL